MEENERGSQDNCFFSLRTFPITVSSLHEHYDIAQPSINGPRRPTPQLEPIDFDAQAAVSGALGL